ncbi:MAG TPA: amino acid ABC transporter permease [Rhodospirillaceae bacterium]|jgi:general L-amino acid transport system permease protein|nr:amino acid ABC transporter permease [Rhodospirillaceae bacterium]MAX64622.1 amino acid ABC transporter permease [Rhodospirillaceae bacterium]MBB58532.1 amino acid ABC transporter permease [Rhodospirillaceae bacterium]HAJ21590.1 amino acid ABC transporter permease [Rhodospirillaceae bacterium]HBM14338.1 amino acid ABC transporter permease [Rhodospirillaceae bacterium]
MSVASDTDSTPQRGGIMRLWYDSEARQVIIQIFTIAVLFALVFYLVRNAVINLDAIGKSLGFDFLFQPANYDINQSFLEYDSRSSNLKAAIVGLLNTFLVAGLGIFIATIVGFVMGVLRLSKNFLMNRLVYCYVEAMRNVPVLLWILLVHGFIVVNMPGPRQALGLGESFFFSNRGINMPSPLPEPLFWATAITFILGVIGAIVFKRYAKKIQDETGKILPVLYVSFGLIVVLPVIVYFITGAPLNWETPAMQGFNFQGGYVVKPELIALTLALALYTSAFIAETVRSGILAVNYGQTEAAGALGLRNNRTLQLVVIPQAMRVIVPPLTSQYLNLTKNSSLAIAIGYMDITATLGGITLNQTGREMECMILVMAIYLCISLAVSSFMNWYNNRIKLIER